MDGIPYTLQWAISFPSKLSLPMNLDSHLIHGCLGPSESTTQRESRSVQPFLGSTAVLRRCGLLL